MSITDELRKSFDQCTFKAGVAPNEFDTVWITKSCALSMLDDIDAAFEAGHERAFEHGKRMGRGTCHITVQDNMAETDGMGDVWLECDKCHWQMPLEPSTPRFNFCPNCGAKAVDE